MGRQPVEPSLGGQGLGEDRELVAEAQLGRVQRDHETQQQLIASLRSLTAGGLVHADLSAYNLLWWRGRLVIIDLPQAVDPKKNRHAEALFGRDVETAEQA